MKRAFATGIIYAGGFIILCLLFVITLVKTLIFGKRALNGLEEDET